MGPLRGYRIIEMEGLGAGPFCGMMLADMGADVVCVRRSIPPALDPARDITRRGKRFIQFDLKTDSGHEEMLQLVDRADAFIEGFRPGVMEKLGLGPDICLQRNPALVYGRITGWGQDGPLAAAAGHDINYSSLTGMLHATGPAGGRPVPAIPMHADFGGGAMFLAFGVVCALLEASRSGKGQVIDAAMTDGTAALMTVIHTLHAMGQWQPGRGSNLLDGGAHFYGVYRTRDDKYISIGSLEPQFYQQLIEILELDPAVFRNQHDPGSWASLRLQLENVFRTRTRAEWCDRLEGTDVCFAPVLDLSEAPHHSHNVARETYFEADGLTQPSPAPRFSRTRPVAGSIPAADNATLESVLADWRH